MTVAVVDGDLIAYRCAASAEHDGQEIAFIRADRLLKDIVLTVDASEYKLFLSGSTNFRYDLYSDYKANRKDIKRPAHLQPLREYLVTEWGAEVTDGHEADDAIGIAAVEGTVVCSLDKDLLQLPGTHYNFVNGEFQDIDELTGWRNFYSQLVLGDRADNVPGFDGKMRAKWPKFLGPAREKLQSANTAVSMYNTVKGLYTSVGTTEEELIRNGRLLYVWRTENDLWQPPVSPESLSEVKQEVVQK